MTRTLDIEILKELSEFMTVEQLVNHISFIARAATEKLNMDNDTENVTSDDIL